MSGCEWRGEACPHCHEMVVVKEIAEHKRGCGHRVVPCSQCGVEMQHRQLMVSRIMHGEGLCVHGEGLCAW